MMERKSSMDGRQADWSWRQAVLERHPAIQARVDALLALVDGADVELADEAERRAIGALRDLGQAVLQDWAAGQAQRAAAPAGATRDGKKKSIGTAPTA